MDNPDTAQKPRWFVRWFSPLRWRLWVLVFPLLNVLAVWFLFACPGLEYDWRINDSWYIFRSTEKFDENLPSDLTVDYVQLEAGPLRVEKFGYTYAGGLLAWRSSRGFSTRDEPNSWVLEYGSYNLNVTVVVNKEWSPW